MINTPIPKVDFIVLCDSVTQAPEGKKTFYGLFDRIYTKKLPFLHNNFFIAIRLVGGRGKHKIGLNIIDEHDKEIFRIPANTEFEFKGPLGTSEFIFQFQAFKFEKDGVHRIEIYYDGKKLEPYEKKFLIEKVQEQK